VPPPQRTMRFDGSKRPLRLRAKEPTVETVLAIIDSSFAQAPVPLGPNIVVFPAVDEANIIREDGIAISDIAVMSAVYGPQRRLKIQTRGMRNIFTEAACSATGVVIDEARIARCVSAMDTTLYVVPRIELTGRAYELTMDFHGDADRPDKEYRHRVSLDALASLPCLMAQDIVDFAGIKISAEEQQLLMERPVRTPEEFAVLQGFIADRRTLGSAGRNALQSLQAHPGFTSLWDVYLNDSEAGEDSLYQFDSLQPPILCDRLSISYAKRLRDLGRPDQALMMLLALVPTHRDDASFYDTLVWSAALWGKPQVTERLFAAWSENDPSYRGHLMRGDSYVHWAWLARGSGFAGTVTDAGWEQFSERLQKAREELDAAIAINPEGWEAHTKMLVVAKGMGFSRDEAERYLTDATRIFPGNRQAYAHMCEYLLRRWHGTSAELLAFGERCLATGLWKEGIPHLVIDCVLDACRDAGTGVISKADATRPEVMDLVKRYSDEAIRVGSKEDAGRAATLYASWCARAGNYAELQPLFPHFFERDRALIPYAFEQAFLYDAAEDATMADGAASMARVRMALYRGEVDAAAVLLEQVEAAPPEDITSHREVPRLRRAVEFARRLLAEKSIVVTPEEMLSTFLCNDHQARWQVEGGLLVCIPGGGAGSMVFPLGLKTAVIEGTVEWMGNVGTVDIVSHACSVRDAVAIRYYLRQESTQIVRNGMSTSSMPGFPLGPTEFRLEWGAELDTLRPFAGFEEVAPVVDDAPGVFAIQIEGVRLGVGSIRIELTEPADDEPLPAAVASGYAPSKYPSATALPAGER